MPDSNTPRDPDAPEAAPAADDHTSPLSDTRAEALLGSTGSAPLPSALGGVNPEELLARGMNTVQMTGAAGGWTPPSVDDAARLFPQYEVLGLLGRGGMGAVYKARQIELDRLIAIKLLPLEISVDADFADRFRREARAMAKLSHPNIITVHDFGTTTEGHLFFAMEFVDGANLHAIIHSGSGAPPLAGERSGEAPLPPAGLTPAQALAITIQVCEALAYAHEQGVVHRDIKPANVMVDQRGRAKVADFGLARLTDPAAEQFGHTMTGTVMGTPDYMAPEQMKGMNVDHRADIYSLGVMLYEMLCKDIPRGFFDPPSVRVGVDARLDDVVKRAMQQQPDRRYQQTTEMQTDVDRIRTTLVVPAPAQREPQGGALPLPAPARKSKPVLTLTLAAVAVIVGAIAFIIAKPGRHSAKVAATTPARELPTATPAATPDEKWVDGLAEWWAKSPDASKGLLVKEARGSRIADGSRGIFLGAGRDIAVRATALGVKGASFWLGLRNNGDTNYLAALVAPGQRTKLYSEVSGKVTVLQEVPLPADFATTDRHTLELRAQGDLITVLRDGQQVAQVRDSSVTQNGRIYIAGAKGTLIEKFEYCELTAQPPSPTPTASATASTVKWHDMLAEWRERGHFVAPFWKDDGSRVEALLTMGGGIPAPARVVAPDQALRITCTAPTKGALKVMLRASPNAVYEFVISPSGECYLDANVAGGGRLRQWPAPAGFDPKVPHNWEFRAVGETLSAHVEGKLIGSATDGRIKEGVPKLFGIDQGTVITAVEYASLGSISATWRDWIAEKRAEQKLAGFGFEDDGTFVRSPNSTAAGWKPISRDGAIRATWKLSSEVPLIGQTEPSISLRKGSPDTGTSVSYTATIGAEAARLDLHTWEAGRKADRRGLGRWPLPSGYDRTQEHTFEIRAVGDLLTISLNGQPLGTVRDSSAQEGGFGFTPAKGASIRKVEYLSLD
ncbi:MAG: serine/threonine-protein kinase, partial [Chthoniobacteraceae bacterium]